MNYVLFCIKKLERIYTENEKKLIIYVFFPLYIYRYDPKIPLATMVFLTAYPLRFFILKRPLFLFTSDNKFTNFLDKNRLFEFNAARNKKTILKIVSDQRNINCHLVLIYQLNKAWFPLVVNT